MILLLTKLIQPYHLLDTLLVPDWGDIVDSGIGLSYRPARLHRLGRVSEMRATVGTPTTQETPAKAGSPETVRAHKEGKPETTAGVLATAGKQVTAMTQAKTVTPTATETPEIILTPTPRYFSRKFAENLPDR